MRTRPRSPDFQRPLQRVDNRSNKGRVDPGPGNVKGTPGSSFPVLERPRSVERFYDRGRGNRMCTKRFVGIDV